MKNKLFFLHFVWLFIGCYSTVNAQSLLETLEKEYPDKPQYELATFKVTRIAIGQSIENRKKGVLQLMFTNRYWNIPNTRIQTFVADRWGARMGAEYGLTDKLTTGAGWTTLEDVFDGYFKYNLFRQRKNVKNAVSVSLFQNLSFANKDTSLGFSDKLAFTSQVLIARKFTPELSLQISPTFIHRNLAATGDSNSHFALGVGGRYKVKPHVSVVSEYYHVANPLKSVDTYGAFALGINWDIRYLMLQFYMTNARSMVEDRFIIQTPNAFNSDDGNFVFGFNAIITLHTK